MTSENKIIDYGFKTVFNQWLNNIGRIAKTNLSMPPFESSSIYLELSQEIEFYYFR